jgi:hypothetical protein
MSSFIVQDGSGVHRVPIGRQMTVGRSRDNYLVLHSAFASRRHAWVWRQGERVIVEDLGSTHGTFVNGQPLAASRFLFHNDVVTMGDARLTFIEDGGLSGNRSPGGPVPVSYSPAYDRTPPRGTPRWMVSQLFCPRCDAPNPPQAEFCGYCGQALGWDPGHGWNWPEPAQPSRAYQPITPIESVAARPFPGTPSQVLPSTTSRGMWIVILVLAILAVILLTIVGVLAVLLWG